MDMVRTDDQILNVAKASPAAVARHDGRAWVGLFSRHAVIEDPVGRGHTTAASTIAAPACGGRAD